MTKVATPAPKISAIGVIFRLLGGTFRLIFSGATAWYRDGSTRMEGERVTRWDARDRIERYWSVAFYALLLWAAVSTEFRLAFIEDATWSRVASIAALTLLALFVALIAARRIVVAVTKDAWEPHEMVQDSAHLSIVGFTLIGVPFMLSTDPVGEAQRASVTLVVVALPLLSGIVSGIWASSTILVDHREKRLLLSQVKVALGGSDSEWARSRWKKSIRTTQVEVPGKKTRSKMHVGITIRRAPAAAFTDIRGSQAKLGAVAPDWEIDERATNPTRSELVLVRATAATRASREIIARSEGLVVGVTEDYLHNGGLRFALPTGTSLSLYPRVDAFAIAEGQRLDAIAAEKMAGSDEAPAAPTTLRIVDWQPHAGFATAARLDSATIALRDAAAEYLRVPPYAIELRTTMREDAPGKVTSVIVSRFPKTDTDARKRMEDWLGIFDAETVRDENEVWLLDDVEDSKMYWNLREDPLAAIQPYPWDAPVSMDAIPFAVDDHGVPVCLKLYESNILVGGLPGGGKSAGATAILAGISRLEHTALYGIDLKRVELSPWLSRFEEIAKTAEDALDLLRRLKVEMDARYLWLEANGLKKLSPTTFSAALPFIVLMIDELARLVLGSDKAVNDEIKELLRDLVAMGRAAGICVVTMTQKPETAVIPSAFRDLLAQRVAFATSTRQMTATVVGDGIEGADAHLIPQALKGVNYLTNEESREPRRTRAYWVPDEEVAGIAERTAHLRVGLTLATEKDEILGDSFDGVSPDEFAGSFTGTPGESGLTEPVEFDLAVIEAEMTEPVAFDMAAIEAETPLDLPDESQEETNAN